MARACLACGDPLGANRTDEHVIPDWLLSELGISAEQLNQFVADRVTGETKNPRPQHPMDAFREGRVCETCNSGWMSVLESEARLVLPVFMNGGRSISAVSESDCLVIARWMLKTAVILSHASPLGLPIPPEQLQFLKLNSKGLPAGVGVFGATHNPTGPFSYLQRNRWNNFVFSRFPETSGAALTDGKEYKLTVQLRHLILLVAYLPFPSSQFMLAAGLHVPIWCDRRILPCYRVDLTTQPYDSTNVVSLFNNCLAALHSSQQEKND